MQCDVLYEYAFQIYEYELDNRPFSVVNIFNQFQGLSLAEIRGPHGVGMDGDSGEQHERHRLCRRRHAETPETVFII